MTKKERNKRYRQRNRILILNYKLREGCILCGTRKELTFHHVNPEEKRGAPGMMTSTSQIRILKEIEKCVVLCDYCHKKIHGFIKCGGC